MILALEAPDGAGKSTLAETIVNRWDRGPAKLVHIGPPPDRRDGQSVADYSVMCYRRLLKETAQPFLEWGATPKNADHLVVLDRAHWGSPIYGGLFRPDTNIDGFGDLGPHGVQKFDDVIARADGMTVTLTPSVETLIERSRGRDDPYLDEVDGERDDQLRNIHGRYLTFARDFASLSLASFLAMPLYAHEGIEDDIKHAPIVPEFFKPCLLSSLEHHRPRLYSEIFDKPETWDRDIVYCHEPEVVADYLIRRMTASECQS
ncbi:thymidylate kinase [Gordonia phage GodonK]|uniref:Thymidylate kinase n=1 Tax=Gordonia phage GodonK TaxID=2562192 RepID=A0A4D6E413_9CAUD|nr:thymidylate kinase [Gordonia phage GodonK]QBZ72782.1 thymidylate kinase [Gordonia phage GodonK]